jgi:RimJ/RimL family protein N-acetyltransferase
VSILVEMMTNTFGANKSGRVIFREITKNDLKILRDWRNSTGILEYNSQFTLLNMIDQKKWFEQINKKNSDRIMFMVINKKKEAIGVCGLIHLNIKDRNADIAIIIGKKKLHGLGLGSEILEMLLKYGFHKRKLHRIGAEIFEYNKVSIKLFKKLNFKREVILRNSLWRSGKWWNVYIFSLLRNEYYSNLQ